MPVTIHPTSVVAAEAQLGVDVRIGPFCVVGPRVTLGDGVVLLSHAVIDGRTRIGAGTRVFPFASLGSEPQDLKFEDEDSELVIGERNEIREYVTMQPGTKGDRMQTVVGNDGLFMVGVHVAHDCVVGDSVILANHATLAGHVVIEDHVFVGGLTAIQQRVRIGRHAYVGGAAGVRKDVIPYGMVTGSGDADLNGMNIIGLKRRGYTREQIQSLLAVYDSLFSGGENFAERVAATEEAHGDNPDVRVLLDFIAQTGERGAILQPRPRHAGG
jgi:UDP-N-acetylglucosamine acyltransferase